MYTKAVKEQVLDILDTLTWSILAWSLSCTYLSGIVHMFYQLVR